MSFQNNILQIWSKYSLFRKKMILYKNSNYVLFKTIHCKYGQSMLFSERKMILYKKFKLCPFQKNYAANKTKQVAWFVSNCGARYVRHDCEVTNLLILCTW